MMNTNELNTTIYDGVTFQDHYVPECPICGMKHEEHPIDGEITFPCGHYVGVYNDWADGSTEEDRDELVSISTHVVETSHELGGTNEWFFDAKSDELNAVMTSAEIAATYDIDDSAIRQAVRRGTLRARKSGNTLLVMRADAEARWGKDADAESTAQISSEQKCKVCGVTLPAGETDTMCEDCICLAWDEKVLQDERRANGESYY